MLYALDNHIAGEHRTVCNQFYHASQSSWVYSRFIICTLTCPGTELPSSWSSMLITSELNRLLLLIPFLNLHMLLLWLDWRCWAYAKRLPKEELFRHARGPSSQLWSCSYVYKLPKDRLAEYARFACVWSLGGKANRLFPLLKQMTGFPVIYMLIITCFCTYHRGKLRRHPEIYSEVSEIKPHCLNSHRC